MFLSTARCLPRGASFMAMRATSGLHIAAATRPAFFLMPAANMRSFSRVNGSDEDSHDDFQPKSKEKSNDEMNETITKWVTENDVVVFMKGTRKMPQCGFSRYVAVLMNAYGVKQYLDVNVLADENLRSTIKTYSNWPTIPQVYIKGEFIGGCDIMKEMHEDGSLRELFLSQNIIKE